MTTSQKTIHWTLVAAIGLLGSCASTAPTASVRDDVYARPDREFMAAIPSSGPEDDYYDPGAAKEMTEKSYYDVAYNDPYYYNYGRFGFGSSVGAVGPAYGYGDPFGPYGSMYGYGSFGTGYGWGSGWSMGIGIGFGSPMYDPYWGYNGFGPYYGPWGGSCYGCYSPIVYCLPSNTVVQHRPSLSSGNMGSGGSSTLIPRMYSRDPAGLLSVPTNRPGTVPTLTTRPSSTPRNSGLQVAPTRSTSTTESRPARTGSRPSRTMEGAPQRSGGYSPSPSGGGSSRPSMGGARPR